MDAFWILVFIGVLIYKFFSKISRIKIDNDEAPDIDDEAPVVLKRPAFEVDKPLNKVKNIKEVKVSETKNQESDSGESFSGFSPQSFINAIIMSEILEPPKCKAYFSKGHHKLYRR